jgi:hypothetical protein
MLQGATVCTHCGAYEGRVAGSGGRAYLIEGVVILALVLWAFRLDAFLGYIAAMLGFMLFVIVLSVTRMLLPKSTKWLPKR